MGELLVPKKKYTIEEYLELAEYAEEKLEYYNGTIHPMPGGTIAHNTIANNFLFGLGLALDERTEYRIFNSDQRIWLPKNKRFVYPDALVICGEPITAPEDPTSIINPLVIVEVLSRSTEDYDRGEKFYQYQFIESFQEYVLVSQEQPEILSYHREADDLWRVSVFSGLENAVRLKTLDVELPLERIYRNIEF